MAESEIVERFRAAIRAADETRWLEGKFDVFLAEIRSAAAGAECASKEAMWTASTVRRILDGDRG